MELQQYWNVIWRRRWVVLTVIVLAIIFSAVTYLTTPKTYLLDAVFSVRQDIPAPPPGTTSGSSITDTQSLLTFNGYFRNYWWLSSEFEVDDYTLLVTTDAFAQAVINDMTRRVGEGTLDAQDLNKLKSDIAKLKPKSVTDSLSADRKNRELTVHAVTNSADLTRAMMQSVADVLVSARIPPVQGQFIDTPVIAQQDQITGDRMTTGTNREITNAAIRVLLGVVVALALAFLLEYLDRSVRDERDAQRVLDLPVIGAIPRV